MNGGGLDQLYEVTAHPEFPENLNITDHETPPKGLGIGTNGYGISRAENPRALFQRLRELGFNTIINTLHGLEGHHDWFACRKGAFQDIMRAARRAAEAGFKVYWNIYLDNRNLEDVPALVDLHIKEFGGTPGKTASIMIPYHSVSQRLWNYEKLRPSLKDVQERLPGEFWPETWDVRRNSPLKLPLEEMTEAHWLNAWKEAPESDDFKHILEPRQWPPDLSYDYLAMQISRDRKVYLKPRCVPNIFLGELNEGKDVILERLKNLPMPSVCSIKPEEAELREEDAELLHPFGYCVRYKAISHALFVGRL